MPVLPVEFTEFGGLNLRDDPQQIQQSAAVDMLNVELDQPGRMRSRDGYAKFTTSAASTTYAELAPFYRVGSATTQLLAGRGTALDVLNSSGGVITSTSVHLTQTNWSLVRFGTPTVDRIYCFGMQSDGVAIDHGVVYWDGTAFTGSSIITGALGAAQQSPDNRLAIINGANSTSRIAFSAAGDAETFGANDFVYLTPGDGEYVQNLTSYGNFVFAFKNTKFFIFTGNSIDGAGNPIFNYRPVLAGVGAVGPRAVAATPSGVCFVDRTGIYITTGGTPARLSNAIDPLFGRGALASAFSSSAINWAQSYNISLGYYNGRLYLSVPTGASTTNDRTYVYDMETRQWLLWDLKVNAIASFRVSNQEEMVFSLASGTNDVCRFGSAYTTDASASITSKYRAGFVTPAVFSSARTRRGYPWPGAEGVVREWLIDGQGTVTVKTAYNDSATLGTGASVTLGTAPVTSQGRDRRAVRGRNVSMEISGTSPWQVSRVIANVQSSRGPGNEAEA